MGSMERYSIVGMQELDQSLSRIVSEARKRPVSVYRYGAPWVWIVSQDDWQGALREPSNYIPASHSLVLLKPQLDDLLASELEHLQAWATSKHIEIPLPALFQALLLQLLYSLPSEKQLYEQLNYNLLYRWFVGLELNQRTWGFNSFIRGIGLLLDNARAVRLLERAMVEVFCSSMLHLSEFSPNLALLHSWLARHNGPLRKR